jgi:tetrapyrrole methylase family protein/MazG family protein
MAMSEQVQRLVDIMTQLRGDNGCPWDKAQTIDTLKKYLLEESYELLEVIEKKDVSKIKEELGDLLFQIIFISQIFKESGEFDINDVAKVTTDKMTRRHPHIFGDKKAGTPDEVLSLWEKEKQKEKNVTAHKSLVDGIPKNQPALLRAHQISSRVARVGFDWHKIDDVIAKIKEETDELDSAIKSKDKKQCEEELGDILFTLANIARKLDTDSEFALHKTCNKLEERWKIVENELEKQNRVPSDCSLDEMESLWQKAKIKNQKEE